MRRLKKKPEKPSKRQMKDLMAYMGTVAFNENANVSFSKGKFIKEKPKVTAN